MPYMKITYHTVVDHVWVKVDDADRADDGAPLPQPA